MAGGTGVSSPMYDLPEHLKIGVTVNGEGPVEPPSLAFDHWACWCGRPGCTLYDEPAILPGAQHLLDAPPVDGPPPQT